MTVVQIPVYALVTGASSGIGLEFSRQLAALHYNLIVVSNEEKIEAVAEELVRTYRIRAYAICMDLSRPDSAQELYQHCQERRFLVKVLINNAGIFSFNEIIKTPPDKLERMLQLHMLTVTQLCRFFGQEMKKERSGYLLNMSSLSAWTPFPGIAAYSATKAYVRTFTRSFGLEMQPYGVSALAVCPGAVATDLYGLPPRYQQLGLKLGVLMTPEQMVHKSLKALFRSRHQLIPGWINRLFIPVMNSLPRSVILFIKRRISRYER